MKCQHNHTYLDAYSIMKNYRCVLHLKLLYQFGLITLYYSISIYVGIRSHGRMNDFLFVIDFRP